MVQLTHTGVWSSGTLSELAGITDLQAVTVDQRLYLVSTSGAYGELASWEWTGTGLVLRDQAALSGTSTLPAPGGLAGWDAGTASGGGTGHFLSFGGAGQGLEAYQLTSDGTLTALGEQGAGALTLEAVLPVDTGQQAYVFGAARDADGIQVWRADWETGGQTGVQTGGQTGSGGLTALDTQPVGLSGSGTDVPDMAVAGTGGGDYLLAVDPGGDSLGAYEITARGLRLTDTASPSDGLWINAPTEVESAEVAGVHYAIVGAGASNSLSVVRVNDSGQLHVTDHVLDDQTTRFAGISALEVVQTQGRTFVLAAGAADDGISLMTLLPGGRLLGLDTLASALGASLEDITALEAVVTQDALQVFASGEGFSGVATLSVALGDLTPEQIGTAGRDVLSGGAGGDLLLGGADDDLLQGHAGADILDGGTGADTLRGGEGADIFVFAADGATDVIEDFELGVDRIDLSGMGRVYTLEALSIQARGGGCRITFQGEVLEIMTASGQSLSAEDFTIGMLFDMAHTPVEPLPPEPMMVRGTSGADGLIGDSHNDTLVGEGGNDLLSGGAGADLLKAEAGRSSFDTASDQVVRLYQAALGRAPDDSGHRLWADQIERGRLSGAEVAERFIGSKEFQKVYGATDNAEFVTLLYRNVLEREPGTSERDLWARALDNGLARNEAVWRFSESAEFRKAMLPETLEHSFASLQAAWHDDVFRLYQATLGREPGISGLMVWSQSLAAGRDYLDVVRGFVESREFQKVYGATDNTAFATLLYENVLGRSPSDMALQNWVRALDNGLSRVEAVQRFAQSKEFIKTSQDDLLAYMRGQGGDDTLQGGAGSDTLFGGALSDTFVFDGDDAGTDHVVGLEAWDYVQLENAPYADGAEVLTALTQQGSDVVLDLGAGRLVFANTELDDLNADMFLFV